MYWALQKGEILRLQQYERSGFSFGNNNPTETIRRESEE